MTAAIRRLVVALCASLIMSSALTPVTAAANRADDGRDDGSVVVPFTKWVTIDPGYPIMAGVTGGAAAGTFSGQVLDFTTTADGLVTRLTAVYEIHADRHSFIALIAGGSSNQTGTGILDGVVLSGWMTGAKVHVNFDAIICSEPDALNSTCFPGTIRLTPADQE
jgi:hypothetical protein